MKLEHFGGEMAPISARFISRVRRRILLARIVECIGASVAIAAASGVLLVGILWLRSQAATGFSLVLIFAAAAFGVIWGIARWPSLFDAAGEADRQLHLDDLLCTLLLARGDDAWVSSLAACAENRCRGMHPSDVIVSRWGLRAFTGAGLLAALLLTLAAFASVPPSASAIANVHPDFLNRVSQSLPSNDQAAPAAQVQIESRPPGPGGVDSDFALRFEGDEVNDQAHSATPQGLSGSGGMQTVSTGSGTGSGRSRGDFTALPEVTASPRFEQGTMELTGGASEQAPKIAGKTESTIAGTTASTDPIPWQSIHWHKAMTDAEQQISTGRFSDLDADLVRAYFDRAER